MPPSSFADNAAVLDLGAAAPGHLSATAIAVERFLSAELFRDLLGHATGASAHSLADACYQRWSDLAGVLAAMPDPIEFALVLGALARPGAAAPGTHVAFLALGRGETAEAAAGASRAAAAQLTRLLVAHLDYAEIRLLDDPGDLAPFAALLQLPEVREIRRRRVALQLTAESDRDPLGFSVVLARPTEARGRRKRRERADAIHHLYPWTPSDDTWRRLLSVLRGESGSAALLVHVLAGAPAAASVADGIRSDLAALERLQPDPASAILSDALGIVRRELLGQLVTIEGETLAQRVFLLSAHAPSAALVATVTRSVDDVSASRDLDGPVPMLRGGASILAVESSAPLDPLDLADRDVHFGPREAIAVLRTPMPSDAALPGLPIGRSRTAAFIGTSGNDCVLGTTNHRGSRESVALDGASRFRHAYLIGQTGTGKSTLMARMALHDIRAGRGVTVLDPHGSLNDEILRRIPPDRIDDVVIVDVADTEHPVGFNVLCISETDPRAYRLARDLLIDDLFAYIRRTYSYVSEAMGPVFETHFRGMLALLLGAEPQAEPYIPNLMLFRPLYTSESFLRALVSRQYGKDPVIDEFVLEVLRISSNSEQSMQNIASYITSKVNRFVSDTSLRNITCQNRVLDVDDLVARQRVVLFYLRRGRFGEYAAGLLASQMVSRLRDAVMRRGAASDGPPMYLYVDEFQTFADERIAELLSEARKFGLSLTLAHQFAAQLPAAVLQAVIGNVGTSVLFRVGPADAAALETLLAPTFRAQDLVALDNFRAYVRGSDELGPTPFSIDTMALSEPEDEELADWAREFSRLAYGRPREEVEIEIDNTYHAFRDMGDDGGDA